MTKYLQQLRKRLLVSQMDQRRKNPAGGIIGGIIKGIKDDIDIEDEVPLALASSSISHVKGGGMSTLQYRTRREILVLRRELKTGLSQRGSPGPEGPMCACAARNGPRRETAALLWCQLPIGERLH